MEVKPLVWMGSSQKDIREMPEDVKETFGFALFLAQQGKKHGKAKPLQGFGSAGVLEIIEDNAGDTYRAVYTVKFKHAVYVLHCFQKKSTKGIATTKQDMELVYTRLRQAQAHAKEYNNGY